MDKKSEILMYIANDGETKIEVTYEGDTLWLTLDQMAELFDRSKSTISKHIKNIYAEGELPQNSTVAKYATVQMEGNREVVRELEYYNLDVIISVGYRVKSLRGTQFRIWANKILKEYMIKGFAMDDQRLKNLGGGNYFDELLSRIRDIRSSERVFWKKILDIYSTSIDYHSDSDTSLLFFKTVQNKMHWATHKHTAAELIYERVYSNKDNLGLTSWQGEHVQRHDTEIAKNYLSKNELDALNKIVTAYLDIAEVHALNKEPMYMKDWVQTIDDYLKMTKRDILENAGKITHNMALEKAHHEYNIYNKKHSIELTQVEKDYLNAIEDLDKNTRNKQ